MGTKFDYAKNTYKRSNSKFKEMVRRIREADVTQKAKGAVATTFNLSTFLEQYAAQMAEEADIAEDDSNTPFLIAMGGDFSVPGVPVGSFAVGLAAYVVDPDSLKQAFESLKDDLQHDESVRAFMDLAETMRNELDQDDVEQIVEEAQSGEKRQKAREAVELVDEQSS